MKETNTNDLFFLESAIELALKNKARGARPFGALIVQDNRVIASAVNNMLESFDFSSHAELEAIRQVTTSTKNFDLSGHKIYASAHPCPMCLAAIAMTNISEIIYAFDNDDAAPFNFSSQTTYDKLKISEIDFIKISKLKTRYKAKDIYS